VQKWGPAKNVVVMAHPDPPQNRLLVTPGQSTTSCLQLFGILVMMQRSSLKHMIVSS